MKNSILVLVVAMKDLGHFRSWLFWNFGSQMVDSEGIFMH